VIRIGPSDVATEILVLALPSSSQSRVTTLGTTISPCGRLQVTATDNVVSGNSNKTLDSIGAILSFTPAMNESSKVVSELGDKLDVLTLYSPARPLDTGDARSKDTLSLVGFEILISLV